MENWPTKFADLLENIAAKIRSVTVDPASRGITIAALVAPILVLVSFIIFFLFFTLIGMLSILLGTSGALGVIGGLFLLVGAFIWVRRKRVAPPSGEEATP